MPSMGLDVGVVVIVFSHHGSYIQMPLVQKKETFQKDMQIDSLQPSF